MKPTKSSAAEQTGEDLKNSMEFLKLFSIYLLTR